METIYLSKEDNQMEQIEKCLHCGGEGKLKGRKKLKVICTCCGASGPIKPVASQAIKTWNRSNKKEQSDAI